MDGLVRIPAPCDQHFELSGHPNLFQIPPRIFMSERLGERTACSCPW